MTADPVAEILTVGTEILLGEIVDTNARHIGRRLRDVGINVYRTATVGDNRARIAAAIQSAADRSELVVVTGGLGPTVDDVTREAAADAAGVDLQFDEALWSDILDRFRSVGREPTANNRRQAHLPQGAAPVANPVGTAPGFSLSVGSRTLVVCLPGVPSEMEAMLSATVIPELAQRFPQASPIHVRLVRTIGMAESEIDTRLGRLLDSANPTVGLAARAGMVDVRIAAKAPTDAQADALIRPVETAVKERLGAAVFGRDGDLPGQVLRQRLADRGLGLAAAEFGLRGGLAARLMEGDAAPSVIRGVEVLADSPNAATAEALAERWAADVALVARYREPPSGTQASDAPSEPCRVTVRGAGLRVDVSFGSGPDADLGRRRLANLAVAELLRALV